MFHELPTTITTSFRVTSENQFDERINAIKNLSDSGISYSLFRDTVSHMHDGQSQRADLASRNNFNVAQWIQKYAEMRNPITLSESQIQSIFDYLITYHSSLLRYNDEGETYQVVVALLPFDSRFFLEIACLKALD